ncbi:hypothetical protein VTO42DRAFT_6061 [Malbranchea cinnamomea]
MAGLRKILNVEKTLFQSGSSEPSDREPSAPSNAPLSNRMSPTERSSGNSLHISALPRLPRMDNQTFQGIEKQFEELHDQFQKRSSRSLSSKRYMYTETKPSPQRTKRHVDVLEAIFCAHRHHVTTPVTPTSLYNEDIADRNLQASVRANSSPYSRIVSAIYQEDVADRNIRINGCNISNGAVARYNMRLRKMRGREGQAPLRSKSQMANRSDPYMENRSALRVISSDQDLRTMPSRTEGQTHLEPPRHQHPSLRSQVSAPTLSSEPCHNRPFPTLAQKEDAGPTVTAKADHQAAPSSKKDVPQVNGKDSGDPVTSRLLAQNARKSCSKRNIHALSINTKLAAPRKNYIKVSPRPAELQVPTPRREPTASLAEIVNSPMSVSTPVHRSPMQQRYNVEEIMNLFKQAYESTQAISQHPTFETLQEAIIREINSHDAFRQINSDNSTSNAPQLSPDLASDDCIEEPDTYDVISRSSSRRSLSRHKHQSRHRGRSSVRGNRPVSDIPGRELSFPAIKGLENEDSYVETVKRRRRHTYAQPPSVDIVQNYRSEHPQHEEPRGRTTSKRHSDILSSRRSISTRPQSSHSFFAKAVSAIFDPSPEPSKRSHSRLSLRSSSRAKLTTKPTGVSSEDQCPQQQPPHQRPPEIHVNKVSENNVCQEESAATVVKTAPAPQPAAPQNSNNKNNHHHNNINNRPKKPVWSTTPIPAAGRQKIPMRISSIPKGHV